MKTATINLSATQINTLGSSPITVIPEPGVGKSILIIAASLEVKFNTIPFGHVTSPVIGLTYKGVTESPASSNPVFIVGPFIQYGAISTYSITNGGGGYSIGDEGYFDANGGSLISGDATYKAVYTVDAVDGTGAITDSHLTVNGYGFHEGSTYGSSITTGSGNGNFHISVSSVLPGDGSGRLTIIYDIVGLLP